MATADRRPPAWLLRWEGLPGQVQVAVVFPVLALVLFVAHLTLLAQPLGRAVVYGLFWAVPATAAVVSATRNEAAKRRRGEGGGP